MLGRQSGLGRGLGALIPQRGQSSPSSSSVPAESAEAEERGMTVREIEIHFIDPNPHQPRRHFDHGELEDLVNSIKEHGILQPLVVTEESSGRFELIAGERRLRAAKIAGLERVPALVRNATEQQKMELALVENIQRSDLSPIDEAMAYTRLQDEFGLTQDEVGLRVGKSRPQVANTIRLLQLPAPIQQALTEKRISASHARTLLSLATEEERMAMFQAMLKGNFTVRQTERRVSPRKPAVVDSNLEDLERRLREHLGLRVDVKRDARGEGEVRIKFLNEEDLREIERKIISPAVFPAKPL